MINKEEQLTMLLNRSIFDGDCLTLQDYCVKVANRVLQLYGISIEPTIDEVYAALEAEERSPYQVADTRRSVTC